MTVVTVCLIFVIEYVPLVCVCSVPSVQALTVPSGGSVSKSQSLGMCCFTSSFLLLFLPAFDSPCFNHGSCTCWIFRFCAIQVAALRELDLCPLILPLFYPSPFILHATSPSIRFALFRGVRTAQHISITIAHILQTTTPHLALW